MIPHNDPCLNPDLKKDFNSIGFAPTSNSSGEYTLAAIDAFDANFRTSLIEQSTTNVLTLAVNRYGNDFYDSLSDLNNSFLKNDFVSGFISEYELISYRIKDGRPITPLEYAQFLKDYNYTPYSAKDSWNSKGRRFVSELDDFYRGSFQESILGKFCGLFSSIFAAIDGFFDLIDDIQGLIGDVFAFLNKIRNNEDPLKAIFEKIKVQALIEAIQKKVEDAVQGVIKKVQKMIENFSIQNIIGQVETFVNEKIVKRITQIKNDILAFFSEENLERIQKRVSGMINYAVSVFENPSLEEIQFLVMKFCSFVTGIEGLINGLKAPLDDFSNRYEEVFNTLANVSNRVTGEAIRAGAIRYTPEKRKEVINSQQERQINYYVLGQTGSEDARDEVPIPTSVQPAEPQEYSDLPTWSQLVSGSHPRIGIQGRWVDDSRVGNLGWERLDGEVKVMLMRLQERFGKKLIINSAWRSPAYNSAIGGADRSQHLNGKAMDITWAGFSHGNDDCERFIDMAIQVGFDGIGRYDSFIHIDNRGWAATWGLPAPARALVSAPVADNAVTTPPPIVTREFGADTSTNDLWPPAGEGNRTVSTPTNTGITRREARKLVSRTKETITFVENGHTYVAYHVPSTQQDTVGKDRFGDEIETRYGGTVIIKPLL